MRRKISIAVVLLVVIAVFIVLAAFDVFTPTAPAAWAQVHAGMSRTEVLALVGTPRQSAWPEKIAETWERSGLVSHRRLFVVYEGQQVQEVWDGTWLRGYGWFHPRRESR